MLKADSGKLNLQLLGDQHRHRCVCALSHFHLGHDHGHGAVAINPDEGIRRKGVRRGITLCAIQREAKQQTASGRGASFQKNPPGNTVLQGLGQNVGTKMGKRSGIHLNLPCEHRTALLA